MRKYQQSGKTVEVETKSNMKKRLRRSPDHGDAASYCAFMVKSRVSLRIRKDEQVERADLSKYYRTSDKKEEPVFATDSFAYGTYLS